MRNNTKTTHYLDDPLWQRLVALPLEDGFIKRLARENGWGVFFAEQVIGEYRKFLYLTQVAGHPVTPSKAVDEAWHLHLLYTHSYWDELCGEVLGKPLHHEPGTGQAGDTVHFAAQYECTRASYQRIFGQVPPTGIWGAGSSKRRRTQGWVATGLGSAALVGASGGDIAVALACFGLVGVVIAAAARSSRPSNRGQGTGSCDSGGSSCGGFFITSGCGTTDTSGSDAGGGDSGGGDGGGSSCGSSCGGGGGGGD